MYGADITVNLVVYSVHGQTNVANFPCLKLDRAVIAITRSHAFKQNFTLVVTTVELIF